MFLYAYQWENYCLEFKHISVGYLTIIPRVRVGYEMIDSQRGA